MTPAKPPTAEEASERIIAWCQALRPALDGIEDYARALASRREASAEPVAWIDEGDIETLAEDGWCVVHAARCDPGADHNATIPLYRGPAQPREPLTPERIVEIRDSMLPSQGEPFDCIAFARAIEREHRIGEQENSHG